MENQQKEFPVIKTDNLILRRLLIEDAVTLLEYWSHPDVTQYLTLEPFTTVEEAVDMIKLLNGLPVDNQGFRWAITRKEDGKVLGTCGFHNFNPEHCRAEVGYELGKEYWRQGIMAEALRAIVQYGFSTAGYNRIEAFVTVGNEKSTGILEKLGFKQDGLLREYEFARGAFVDLYCYSLLKSEYIKQL